MRSGFLPGLFLLCVALTVSITPASDSRVPADAPRYDADGRLLYPDGYREWVYLSSGLGMTYTGGGEPLFTNVFVAPTAYREFLATGKWPEKTVFVVEERSAATRGSINKGGHYQADFKGLGVEVKDGARFPDTWAYFNFGSNTKSSKANPKAACWQCHEEHAAVEHSFVQFYPTLIPIAKRFGVYRESRASAP
jgi:hypothetical protein